MKNKCFISFLIVACICLCIFHNLFFVITSDSGMYLYGKTPESTISNNVENVDNEKPNALQKGVMSERVTLFNWFTRGGVFMWPLLILAAVGMGFVIERFIFFKKADLNPREFIEELESHIEKGNLDEVEKLCRRKDLIFARIILKGMQLRSLGFDHVEKAIATAGSIEVTTLEKGLSILSSIGNIAPLLGFLGTVSGMIAAFQSIAEVDQVSARLVAGGIYEALITTETGLIIAIPVLGFYNYFVHRIESFISDVERIASDILEKLLINNA